MKHLFGFRQFIEEMDPTPDKTRDDALGGSGSTHDEKEDYFGVLQDEEGLTWKHIKDIFEGEPWVSAHFGIKNNRGQLLHKLSAWKIVKGTLTPHGADIELKPGKHNKSYLKSDGQVSRTNYEDTKRYHLNRKELMNFLTTGWTPAIQGGVT